MATIIPFAINQYFDNESTELSGGKLYFYEAGTSTKKDVYSSSAGTTVLSNPVILDSNGRNLGGIWLGEGSYKTVLADSTNVILDTVDNVNNSSVSTAQADSIAALKALGEGSDEIVNVLGYYTPGDGGGGQFWWNESSSATDNGGTIIQPAASTGGRWIRIYDKEIDIKWFGAKGDGSNNDTALISACQTWTQANTNDIFFSGGSYLIDSNLTFGTATGIRMGAGAYFEGSGAVDVTFNGVFIASATQCFGTNITAVFGSGSVSECYPEWWGIDGTADEVQIQLAIDSIPSGGKTVLAGKTYTCDAGLDVDTTINLEGQGRANTILDFSSMGSGSAMTLSCGANNVYMKNLRLNGNTSIDGLTMDGSVCDIARGHYDNMVISTFDNGMVSSTFTTASFNNVQFSSCTLGWDANSQTNNITMTRCTFANCDKFADFSTCEGITFIGCQFQNITDVATTYAMTLRQSTVIFYGGYWENLSNANIANIGGSGDAIGCTFIQYGGIIPPANIVYRENLVHSIHLVGVRTAGAPPNDFVRVICSDQRFDPLRDGTLSNINDNTKNLQGGIIATSEHNYDNLIDFGNEDITFINGTYRYVTYDKSSGSATTTIRVTPGSYYTLVVAGLRETGSNITWTEQTGGVNDFSAFCNNAFPIGTPQNEEEWNLFYVPVVATGDTIKIACDGELYLKVFSLREGIVFPKVDINSELVPYADSITTQLAGNWNRGMIVWDKSPTEGTEVGWKCITQGNYSSVSDTGNADGSTAIITGMSSTTSFRLGDWVQVSAGFPTTGPYQISEVLSSTSIRLDTASDAVQAGITVDFIPPVWAKIGQEGNANLESLYLTEQGNADADVSGQLQIWTDNTTPQRAMATNEDGDDHFIMVGKRSTANISDPPTDAELDSAFGTPSTLPPSFLGIVDDEDTGTKVFFCYTTGTDGEWYWLEGTKAV